jgi:exopolysaccharide biosynthesis WecB/TagA/CpsF family protein
MKYLFTNEKPEEIIKQRKHGILNFQNLYSIYLFKKEEEFRKSITQKGNLIFPDGKLLSVLLRKTQVRGPTFTLNFLKNENENKKHFFIGIDKEQIKILNKLFPNIKSKKIRNFQLPVIKGLKFSEEEIKKILQELKKFKPDYVWVCIGNPKQEILSNQLFKKYKTFYFNIGAGMDFVLGKKKESPKIFRIIWLEWFYRLITDFRHSKKKVLGSFIGLRYLFKS